jgi:hypothetical protein
MSISLGIVLWLIGDKLGMGIWYYIWIMVGIAFRILKGGSDE